MFAGILLAQTGQSYTVTTQWMVPQSGGPYTVAQIAANAVKTAPPDGYTLYFGSTSTFSPTFMKDNPIDSRKELQPISAAARPRCNEPSSSFTSIRSAWNVRVAGWMVGPCERRSAGAARQIEEGLKRGIRVKTSSYTRHHVNITMTQAKAVSNYTNSILANLEATEDGYDEALLLDSAGFVSEGAGENIFVIKNGVIYTPDLSAGALNGITRNTIFHIAKDLGLEIVQKRITRDEVYIADEAFFTGTAAEVTPIRELDRIQIGQGSRGPITEKIQSAFFDIVNGRNAKYAEWLTKV